MTERSVYEHTVAPQVSDEALLAALELLWMAAVDTG
jgi:hypothetical protein